MAPNPTLAGQLRLPEFHGDAAEYPLERWDKYIMQIDLAYQASGLDATDEMKKAHILSGLQGKARHYFELNLDIKDKDLRGLKEALKKKFDKPNLQGLIDIGLIIQNPEESVSEYVSRLREAAKAIKTEEAFIQVTHSEAVDADAAPATKAEIKKYEEHFAQFSDRFIFYYFLRGLLPHLKQVVMAKKPHTLTKALTHAEEQEEYMELYGGILVNANIAICSNADATNEMAAQRLQALDMDQDINMPYSGQSY